MIEVALCLAIIGFALVSILLVLPSGMNTQRDTREETIIGQDASMLLEAIRGGARGMDDLTNYVTAITNYFTDYNQFGKVVDQGYFGYTYNDATYWDNGALALTMPSMHLTNGLRIIGILSTPEYLSGNLGGLELSPPPTTLGVWPVGLPPINYTLNSAYASNHVVAYIRSFSGLAAEKPPQNNQIMQEDTFSYRVLCVNAPVPMDTNIFQPVWQSQPYSAGAQVFYFMDFLQAIANTLAADIPGQSGKWVRVPNYAVEMLNSQRELRLLFEWPQLPNGNVGGFRQSFRTTVAGQLMRTNYSLYYPPAPVFPNPPGAC